MNKENISVDSDDFSLAGSDEPGNNSLDSSDNSKVEGTVENMIAELTTAVNKLPQRSNAGQRVSLL